MGNPDERRNKSWFGETIQNLDGAIARPKTEGGVVRILRNRQRYPSPVRPVGSRHSMTRCIEAASPSEPGHWGTIVDMTGITKLRDQTNLQFGDGKTTVTVPAGRRFVDVAREVRAEGYQFRVNTELGSLSMGAAACGATKDSSFHEECGQVCSDVVGMRLIRPNGKPEDLKEGDPDFDALRCSYGLFGIVTEVTYRVFPHEYISMKHVKLTLDQFKELSPDWLNNRNAVFLYLFPYYDRLVAELRTKPSGEGQPEERSIRLQIRNYFWEKGMHDIEKLTGTLASPAKGTAQMTFDEALVTYLAGVLDLPQVSPVAQIVDFDKEDMEHRFTFSMWAFPEEKFPGILTEYFALCKSHETSFRTGLPHVSYHISKDQSSLLSYSFDGPVWTLDPVSPYLEGVKADGWAQFLKDYNEFCSCRGGVPLFNQTPHLTRQHVTRAFAKRLLLFEAARKRFDPENRMLNAYFAELLAS